MEVDHETEGHMYDTYVKRVVHMRGKLYYKYAKRRLTEFEMQSLEDRWYVESSPYDVFRLYFRLYGALRERERERERDR